MKHHVYAVKYLDETAIQSGMDMPKAWIISQTEQLSNL